MSNSALSTSAKHLDGLPYHVDPAELLHGCEKVGDPLGTLLLPVESFAQPFVDTTNTQLNIPGYLFDQLPPVLGHLALDLSQFLTSQLQGSTWAWSVLHILFPILKPFEPPVDL